MAEIGATGRIKVLDLGQIQTIMQIVGLSFLLFRQNCSACRYTSLASFLPASPPVLTLWSISVSAHRVAGAARRRQSFSARRNGAGPRAAA